MINKKLLYNLLLIVALMGFGYLVGYLITPNTGIMVFCILAFIAIFHDGIYLDKK
jgi:hypothetical protein